MSVKLTGSSALWANFNKVNHSAMIKSEVLSWPVTMIVLVMAFGSLVAAGLPLMLTMVGLLTAAGALVLATHLAPVSIWALNFAMMFALALGIDYALFIVVRFRAALHARAEDPDRVNASVNAIAETMGTAGKAVAFSGADRLGRADDGADRSKPRLPQHGAGHHAVGRRRVRSYPHAAARRPGQARTPHRRRPDPPAGGRSPGADALRPPGSCRSRRPRWLPRSPPASHGGRSGAPLAPLGCATAPPPWLAGGIVVVDPRCPCVAGDIAAHRHAEIAIIPQSQTARAGYYDVVNAFGPGAPGTLSVLTPSGSQAQTHSRCCPTKRASQRRYPAARPPGGP